MSLVITWAHRNAELQADTLVDWFAATVTPPAGLHYALQVRDSAGVLLAEKLDIDGATATVQTNITAPLSFRLWSVLDGLASMQAAVWTQTQDTPDAVSGVTITAATWTAPAPAPAGPLVPMVAPGPPLEFMSFPDGSLFYFQTDA